jgi:hypothetical protein
VTEQLKDIYIDRRLKAVTEISQARLLAVAIKLSKFDDTQKAKLLELWEKISFRVYGLFRKDSRTAVGDYVKLAKYLITKNANYKTACSSLNEIGNKFPSRLIPEELSEKNCYDEWKEEARYFFFRYEEFLAKAKSSKINEAAWSQIWNDSPVKSIEHIYPQNPKSNWSVWRGKIGRGKKAYIKNIHRLGNLLLLTPPENSRCGNKAFDKKKAIYSNVLLRMKDEIVKKTDWNLKTIVTREKKLMKWAKETWG